MWRIYIYILQPNINYTVLYYIYMCIVIHKYIHNYMNRAFPPTMTAQLRISSESFGSSACDQGDDLAVDIPWCRAVPLQKAACTGDASATGHSWA
jgi:hypothetical protein